MSEQAVLSALEQIRVLPVVALDDPACVAELCAALLDGGVGCLEIAFRTDAAAVALQRAADVEGMLVGAGTVLTVGQAKTAADAGAAFAVAPGTDDEVVAVCADLGLPFFPGVATASELGHALRLGRTTVKVFPAAQLGGPGFLRAVAATFPQARFIPTGGIDGETLPSYLALPSVLACGGTWIADTASIRERRWEEIAHRARAAVEVAR
jgi:2-dehydro-3-deoxyphosphogluconate aldolase/(4S)-4-hydroxy-2-oxoglutarate aldolase